MKVKTTDLIGDPLDWAVADAENINLEMHYALGGKKWEPSTDWSQGGPIIEQGEIELLKWGLDEWAARDTNYQFLNTPQEHPVFAEGYGPTPLIATMRCFVASRLGDEVDIPKELLT